MRAFQSFSAATIFTLLLCRLAPSTSSDCAVETETLCVNQVNEDGFGDYNNHYAWSMATFDGSVYVATMNVQGGLAPMAFFFLGMDFTSNGTQIFKGDPDDDEGSTWTWTRVVTDGLNDAENYGVRSLEVVGDYLYGVTANHVSGFEVWRTNDGTNWEAVVTDGFGDFENTSGRGLAAYKGYIYVGAENRASGARIYRRAIEDNGDFVDGSEWEEVVTDGLGNANNYWFADFTEYNGYLYTGTLNVVDGMELYRTLDGVNYEKLFDGGNGNPRDWAAMRLTVYHDKLYVGTMNFVEGSSLLANTDKGNGKNFQTVFGGGNGNRMNAYVWSLQVYQDRLYVGTFNMFDEFDLFSCQCDKSGFLVETNTGFDNEYQYGIRSMALFEDKMMIGSATARADRGCQVYQTQPLESTADAAKTDSGLFMHEIGGSQSATPQVSQIAILLGLVCIGAFFLCVGVCIGNKVTVKRTADVSQV